MYSESAAVFYISQYESKNYINNELCSLQKISLKNNCKLKSENCQFVLYRMLRFLLFFFFFFFFLIKNVIFVPS